MSAPKPYKTEIELIDACKHGNRSAQRHLYDKYAARMYAVCLKYARSAEVAKDYLQEGFVTVFTKIGSYAGEGSFEGWMRRIFVNVALMDLRRNDVLGDARDVMELRSEAPRVDDVSAKLEHKDLLRLIMEMPLGFRTVFNLSIVEGYSHQEISQKLGISEGGLPLATESGTELAPTENAKFIVMEEKDMNKGWDEFDERIREALRDLEVPLDVDMFPAIQETLKHRTWIRRFRRIGVSVAAAAVLFLGWVMISPSPEPAVSVVSHPEMPVAEAIPAVEEEADQPDAVVRPSVQQPVASRPAKQSVVVALTEESPVVQSEVSDPVLHQQEPVSVQTQPAPAPQQPQPDPEQSVGTTDVQQTVAENLYLAEADASGSHRPWSVGLASTLQGGLSGGSNNYNPMASVSSSDGAIFQVGERSLQPLTVPTHHFPLTLALQAQWSLSQDWMIGTGLSYSRLHSQYEALHNNQLQVDVDQVLHYLGIPVFVNYSILRNQRLNVYASLGGMVEKAVCMDFRLRDLRDQVIQERVSVDGFQYSLHAGLGLEYRFLSWLGLFVDPSLAYYFDNHQPMNLRTAQSLQMRLDVGLRLLL